MEQKLIIIRPLIRKKYYEIINYEKQIVFLQSLSLEVVKEQKFLILLLMKYLLRFQIDTL
jgi:hypothetical protein